MATGFFHHFGTFLLFAATILLIITDISSPVVNEISMLRVDLANATSTYHSAVTFGTFGHCIINVPSPDGSKDYCTKSMVGYLPAQLMGEVEGTSFDHYQRDVTNTLTKVMILHPIATGICFIAFVLAIGAGIVGSFLAALVALLAFLVTVVALICDFVLFATIKRQVNNDGTGSDADYGTAMWTLLAAAICTFLGAIVVFFTCCSARLHRRRTATASTKVDGYAPPARRRRWW